VGTGTPLGEYAHNHGWNDAPDQVMLVLAADAPISTVHTDGNDPSEGLPRTADRGSDSDAGGRQRG